MKPFLIVLAAGLLASCESGTVKGSSPRDAEAARPAKDSSVIVLDAAQQQNGHVTVAQVRTADVASTLTVPGRLTVSEDRTWHVGAIAGGRIEAVSARVGDSVTAGQVLGRIHSHEVHEARAGYQEAAVELQRAESIEPLAKQRRDRAQRLFDLKAGSRQDIESAEAELRNAQAATQKARSEVEKERAHLNIFRVPFEEPAPENEAADDIPVSAPAPGLVLDRKVTLGSVVNTGDELFAITDPSSLWMIAAANETDLSRLHEGQHVQIETRAWPGRIFAGRILKLGEQLDPETRTLQVRILVPNPIGLLKPEMYATASLRESGRHGALLVPEEAVQDINGVDVVFVRRAGNEFEARTVKAGGHVDGATEILQGLAANEAVVVKGSFLLKSQMLKNTIQDN
jgi:cobalt-zinc-cadmium efflux system membrane fusion protein